MTTIAGVLVTVDRLITNASGTYTAVDGTSDIEVIPSATGIAASWGVKLLGVANKFSTGKCAYWIPNWELTLADFGTTVVTNSVAAYQGLGTYEQIAELEFFLQGHEGPVFRSEPYAPGRVSRADATSGIFYDVMKIGWFHDMTTDLGSKNQSRKWLTLAMDTVNNAANAVYAAGDATSTVFVADNWIVTSWAVTGMSAQAGNLT